MRGSICLTSFFKNPKKQITCIEDVQHRDKILEEMIRLRTI